MSFWNSIAKQISTVTGVPFQVDRDTPVGGGCINSASRISGNGCEFFVKTNACTRLEMFEAEFDGLQEMAAARVICVPVPVCVGADSEKAWLVMENLEFGGRGGRSGDDGSIERLGQNLATMHRVTQSRFGWHRDNTIGSTPQSNDYDDHWTGFWRDRRLAYQFELAARNGFTGQLQRRGDRLLDRIDQFFDDAEPQASLLHGDLWSGNYAITVAGEPVIFDPATYYGDRETDIAMTELFGGFPPRFYDAYNEAWPLSAGYSLRKTLYNLYHILNHLNLFGGGYLGQAEQMTNTLLGEVSG